MPASGCAQTHLATGGYINTCAQAATGYFDVVNSSRCSVAGWAYDPDDSNASISVNIYKDSNSAGVGTFVANCTANVPRADVNSTVGISGDHGFNCVLPVSYRGSGNHVLDIYAVDIDGTPNNPLLTNSRQLNCLPIPDLAIDVFTVTPCTPSQIITNGSGISVCPSTPMNLSIKNLGAPIPAGRTIPYRFEKQTVPSGPWSLVTGGTVTGPLDTDAVANISAAVNNLPLGATKLRAQVNLPNTNAALGEIDFSNNISPERSITYNPPDPVITITTDRPLIRRGGTVNVSWTISAGYPVACTLVGPGIDATGVSTSGSDTSDPLLNTQQFTISCPAGTTGGLPYNAVSKSVSVEVVPTVQEI